MKTKFLAAALAALTLGVSLPAAAQNYDRYRESNYGDQYRQDDYRGDRGDWRRGRADITIFVNGRTMRVDREDRLFRRLVSRPYNFMPGLTYEYTDRCNRWGCVVFVYDGWSRRPVDRIFAPHLQLRSYSWRARSDFDRDYRNYGRYDRNSNWYEDWRRDVERDAHDRGRN